MSLNAAIHLFPLEMSQPVLHRSLPPLIPFIIFGSYWLGCTVLGQPMIFSLDNFSLEVAGTVLLQYILGAVLLAALVSAVSWLITFTVLVACGRHNN